MRLVIQLMQLLAARLRIPCELRGILAGILIAAFGILIIFVIRRSKPKPFTLFVRIFLMVLLCLQILQLFPYVDSRTKVVAPELVAVMDAAEDAVPSCRTYYIAKLWSYTRTSLFDMQKSYGVSVDEREWFHANATEPSKYTYIISYGYEITGISYNIWDSKDYTLKPWDGVSLTPEIEYGAYTGDIYLYRIELVPIDIV